MDNTQHTYFAELKLALQKAGYTVQPVEDGLLPIEWNDRSFTIGVTYNFKSGKAFKRKAVEAGSADEKNRL